MELSIRLWKLIETRTPLKKRGAISAIATATGLERHAVSDLINNRSKYVSRHTLAVVCDFLVRENYVRPDEVPGILFGVEFGEFWPMLAQQSRLDICVGERTEKRDEWIVSADAYLMGELQHALSRQDVEEAQRRLERAGRAERKGTAGAGVHPLRPRAVVQHLVTAPPREGQLTAAMSEARRVYDEFTRGHGPDRGLVCLGSIKSNPVIETAICDVCSTPDFQPDTPRGDRGVPLYVCYRDDDPQPESSFGGISAPGRGKGKPGFYFRQSKGRWSVAECTPTREPAMIFYAQRKTHGRLLVVLGGFTSVGTRLLATYLTKLTAEDLAPSHDSDEFRAGAAVLEFKVPGDRSKLAANGYRTSRPKVHRLSGGVLESCLSTE